MTIEREVTSGESMMIYDLFGLEVDPNQIRIYNYDITDSGTTRTYAAQNQVCLLDGDYAPDLSKADIGRQATFIHECAHVWQHQNTSFKSTKMESDKCFEKMKYESVLLNAQNSINNIEGIINNECSSKPQREQDRVADAYRQYHQKALDSLSVVIASYRAAERKYKSDKRNYVDQEAYDPVIEFGPLPEYESQPTAFAANGGDPILQNILRSQKPIPGERLHEFLWRASSSYWKNKGISSRIELKKYMKQCAKEDEGTGNSLSDYNYLNGKPGSIVFFDLRDEAQAELISDYFLLKKHIDPRTVNAGESITALPRPPLVFYEKVIPFINVKYTRNRWGY